jgi:pilus assembly protein CpaB
MADRRVLIAALVLGAIAAGLAVAFLASAGGGDSEPAAATTTTRSVVVAVEEIEPGDTVVASMLEVRELPVSVIAEGAAEDIEEVVGETARYPISSGEQINAARLVEPPTVQSLSFQIPVGMRGFTIPVSVNDSPAALLAPGDFVDVLVAGETGTLITADSVIYGDSLVTARRPSALASAIGDDGALSGAKAVTTLLQNVQVMTVQREYVENGVPYDASVRGAPPESESISYVTFALSPEDAQLLWLASQDGDITLTLRAFGDDDVATVGAPTRTVRSQP